MTKKVLIIPSNLDAKAIVWLRCVLPAKYADPNQFQVRILTKFPNNNGTIDLSMFEWADCVVMQRFYEDNEFLRCLRKGYDLFEGVKLYESDDMVWDIPFKQIRAAYDKTKDFTERIIKEADAITCTTKYFANQFKEKFGKKKVFVIPNALNRMNWDFPRQEHDKVRVIYMAGGTHWKEVEFIKDIFNQVKKTHDIETYLLSPYYKEKEGEGFDHVYGFVPYENYAQFIRGISPDISVAPLVEKTPFNFSKSEIKFIDGTLGGAVSVLEDCETYDNVSNDACVKAKTKKEWVNGIIKLCDKKTREDIFKLANKEVNKKYIIQSTIRLWEKAFKTKKQ